MAAGPRLLFVRFPERNSPRLKPWLAHARRVLGEAEDDQRAASEGSIVWQLVSANNRELARGLDVYETFEEARTAVNVLVASSGSLTVEPASEAGHGLYGWYMKLEGRPVATCARWYLTERDRRSSISLAVRSLPVATVHLGARLTESLSERASLA
jgi:hypothetical protein